MCLGTICRLLGGNLTADCLTAKATINFQTSSPNLNLQHQRGVFRFRHTLHSSRCQYLRVKKARHSDSANASTIAFPQLLQELTFGLALYIQESCTAGATRHNP